MKIYRLHISPDEAEAEGIDCDEWFSSREAAEHRRRELIDDNPYLEGKPGRSDYQIDRVLVAVEDLSPKRLVLALLNRRGWMKRSEIVLTDYEAPEPPSCPSCGHGRWAREPNYEGKPICGSCGEPWP